jgi:hypothetical protein
VSTDTWNFGDMDDDALDNQKAQKQGSFDTLFTFNLRPDTPVIVWFLTDPGDKVPGDWVNYRECPTWDGLTCGVELPDELKWGVPVWDVRWVENEITGKAEWEIDNEADPLTAGKPGQQMFKASTKSKNAKTGLVAVKWKTAINVVDATTGYHKVMKVGKAAKESLKEYFRIKAEDGGFDITGRPYQLLYSGEGYDWKVAIKPLQPGTEIVADGKKIIVPEHPELPDPVDVRDTLKAVREQMDEFIANLPTASGRPVNTSMVDHRPPPDWAVTSPESATPDEVEAQIDLTQRGAIAGDKYEGMSPARLRSLLTKAGHAPERGLDKAALLSLAREHQV